VCTLIVSCIWQSLLGLRLPANWLAVPILQCISFIGMKLSWTLSVRQQSSATHYKPCYQSNMTLQEDLAAAEAELAGWYETMQRETNALKRIYDNEALDASDTSPGAGAEGKSPSGQGPKSPEVAGLLRKSRHTGEKADKIAARQLPQVIAPVRNVCHHQSELPSLMACLDSNFAFARCRL